MIPLWATAALVAFAIVVFAPQVLNDGDTYSHVATGEWILRQRTVPHADPFSTTFAGQPWVAHEWLSELLMALAFRAAGWTGVVLLVGGAVALALGSMARYIHRWLDAGPAAVTLIVAAACVAPGLLARPHILVLPLLVAWVVGLLLANEHGRVPWRLLPLMLLWANMHGSFVFGLALVAPFALEAAQASRQAPGPAWRPALIQWGLFGLAAAGMATLTPHGWHGLLFPFQLTGMNQLDAIGEWQAPNFRTLQPVELGLLTVLYVCLSRGVKIPVCRLLVLLGLLHLTLQHARHGMLAGVVGALVLAEPLGRAFAPNPAPAVAPDTRVSKGWLLASAAVALAVTAARAMAPVVPVDGPGSPVSALQSVPPALAAQPVLNDYSFGGYLIFRGLRPFIDGRADMFGDAFLADYRNMMQPDPALIAHALEARGIQWTLLGADSPALPAMDAMPGWRRMYQDGTAIIHVRSGASWQNGWRDGGASRTSPAQQAGAVTDGDVNGLAPPPRATHL